MIGDIEYTYNPHVRAADVPVVYDAYGSSADLLAFPSDTDSYSLNQLFQGMQHDPEQPQFYDRYRAFHLKVQRWINTEPLAYVDGLNAHAAMGAIR